MIAVLDENKCKRHFYIEIHSSLPGQSLEALTAENGCFERSDVASGPPFTCADKDVCK